MLVVLKFISNDFSSAYVVCTRL